MLRRLSIPLRGVALAALACAASQCVKKTTSTEIFKDTFNRDNSSTLGASWTINLPVSGQTFTINGNLAKPLGGGETTEATLPTALYTEKVVGNFKVSAKFSITGAANYDSIGYLIGRSAARDIPTDAYLCGYYYDTTTTAPNQKYYLSLRKTASNVTTEVAKVLMHTLTNGRSDTITFSFVGSTIKCEITGGSTISITTTDSSFGDGYTGMLGGGNNLPYLFFDDFVVERL